jgi:hypothetical protein
VCTRGSDRAPACGPSTSPLGITVGRLVILALLLLGCSAAHAEDSVRIVFSTGGEIGSHELADIQVTGESSRDLTEKPSVERYFAAVRGTLTLAGSKGAWEQPPALHADTVKVTIQLDGRTYTFFTSYGQNGPQVHLGASDYDRKQLATLKAILDLTMAHLGARLKGGTE